MMLSTQSGKPTLRVPIRAAASALRWTCQERPFAAGEFGSISDITLNQSRAEQRRTKSDAATRLGALGAKIRGSPGGDVVGQA
jgi:hypothetical protein